MNNKVTAQSIKAVELMLDKTRNSIIDQLNRVNAELNILRRMIANTDSNDGTSPKREEHDSKRFIEETWGTDRVERLLETFHSRPKV